MKKKILSSIILLLSVVLLLLLVTQRGNGRSIHEYIVDEGQIAKLKSSRTAANEKLLETLMFNEYELFYDNAQGRWFYSLIEDSEFAYEPYVEYNGVDEDISIAICGEISQEIIKNNGTLKVLAYNDKFYQEYELVCTTLPIMEVNFYGTEWDFDTQIDMRLFDNRKDATQRYIVSEGLAHVRGASSRRFDKKNFKLKLRKESYGGNVRANDISLLGMRQKDDWVLYAGYNEYEKVRNVFTSNLWYESCADNNIFGIDNGMEYKYIELFVNSEYFGLYALGYPIDETQLGLVDSGRMETSDYSYKKTSWDEEYDNDLNDDTIQVAGYKIFSERKQVERASAWRPLKDFYIKLAVSESSEIYESVDIKNAIDVYLFLNMIQASDTIQGSTLKNLYITAKYINGRYVMLYTPWDLDSTWGNVFINEPPIYSDFRGTPEMNYEMLKSPVRVLMNQGDTNIINMVKQRYKELRETTWSEASMNEMLDAYEANIYDSGAFLRDEVRWPEARHVDVNIRLDNFRQYVSERLEYMDKFVEELK